MELSTLISKMTLGTVQLGMNYGIANNEGKPDEDKAFRILDSAFESGVSCIDTAADYGDSENVIGKWIKATGRKRTGIAIVTKFRLGKTDKSKAESAMMRSFERSLKNLNTGYIDILLMHDAGEYRIYKKEISAGFEKLLSGGLLRAAGASCYEYKDIAPMLSHEMFSAFQVPVNLLDMRITGTEAARNLSDKLVFGRSIFLQGLFFLNPSTLKGNLKEAGKYVLAIRDMASTMNISIAQLAATYVKSLNYVNSMVIGADNPTQVKENIKLIEGESFSRATLDEIEQRMAGAPEWLLIPYLWDKQKE
jgi:aryl-alcohol dehydrogenase-like predicted oxidoreductase